MAKCYVVWKGHKTGVFETWEDCQKAVAGYSGAKYKSFPNLEEAKKAFNPIRPPASKSSPLKTQAVKTAPKFEVIQRFNFPVQIFTDGSCDPNPGPCASGVVVVKSGEIVESWLGAYTPAGTNNIAELKALEYGLRLASEFVSQGLPVEILSDSAYSLKAVAVWAEGWKANGWTKKGGELANVDLIKSCHELLSGLGASVQLTHVEGHAGALGNERADQIAALALAQQVEDWRLYSDCEDLQQMQA